MLPGDKPSAAQRRLKIRGTRCATLSLQMPWAAGTCNRAVHQLFNGVFYQLCERTLACKHTHRQSLTVVGDTHASIHQTYKGSQLYTYKHT
jgi:hypothetical protein